MSCGPYNRSNNSFNVRAWEPQQANLISLNERKFCGQVDLKGAIILIVSPSAKIISDFTWGSSLNIVQTTMFIYL